VATTSSSIFSWYTSKPRGGAFIGKTGPMLAGVMVRPALHPGNIPIFTRLSVGEARAARGCLLEGPEQSRA
jgi:hypothetical protein